MPPASDVTQLLKDWHRGEARALERVMPLVYERLRSVARRLMAGERPDHTLGATALLHEAYLRLADRSGPECRDRVHFFSLVARQMRQLLVDHARLHGAAKRGAGAPKLPLGEVGALADRPGRSPSFDLLLLDQALEHLAAVDRRRARILELRYFAGLTVAEVAELLGVSPATVVADTRLGLAWLTRHLRPPERRREAG